MKCVDVYATWSTVNSNTWKLLDPSEGGVHNWDLPGSLSDLTYSFRLHDLPFHGVAGWVQALHTRSILPARTAGTTQALTHRCHQKDE